MSALTTFWARHARRTQWLGKALWPLGWLLLTFGIFGHIGTAAEAVRRDGEVIILADLYPGLPTAFIPEGWLGFGLAATLVLSGWLCKRRQRSTVRLQS